MVVEPPVIEAFAPADPTAVVGRRILAGLINTLLYIVVATIAISSGLEYIDIGDRDPDTVCEVIQAQQPEFTTCVAIEGQAFVGGDLPGVFWAVTAIQLLLIYVVWVGRAGLTVGHALCGLRVVGTDGRPPGMGRALLRLVFWVVDAAPWVVGPLVALVTTATTVGHRRVGDMAAKTYVIRRHAAGTDIGLALGLRAESLGVGTGTSNGPAPPTPPPTPDDQDYPYPPRWDADRNTFLLWDRANRRWLQWDEEGKRWWGPTE